MAWEVVVGDIDAIVQGGNAGGEDPRGAAEAGSS